MVLAVAAKRLRTQLHAAPSMEKNMQNADNYRGTRAYSYNVLGTI